MRIDPKRSIHHGVPVNIASGERVVLRDLTAGGHLYQCCIHPWMRALVEVEDD